MRRLSDCIRIEEGGRGDRTSGEEPARVVEA